MDSIIISLFFLNTKHKTGITLTEKTQVNGDINISTTQLKFNIPTFIIFCIFLISASATAMRFIDSVLYEKEIKRMDKEIDANTDRINKEIQLRQEVIYKQSIVMDSLKTEIDKMKFNLK